MTHRPFLNKFGVWLTCVAAIGIMLSFAVTATHTEHLHDFISYYYGTLALKTGLNPYDSKSISQLFGATVDSHLRFVYPPQMSWLFRPFLAMSFSHARTVFIISKLIVIAGIFGVWARYFRPNIGHTVVFLLIALFGFHQTFEIDITSGNIASVEALLIWGGVGLFLARKPVWAGLCIGIAASFKLTPILLLGGFFIAQDTKKNQAVVTGLCTFALIQLMGILAYPELYRLFLTSNQPLDSSGFVNPSSLALLQYDAAPWIAAKTGLSATLITKSLYGIWLAGLAIITGWWVRHRHRYTTLDIVTIVVMIYALAMPRFKDYSFVIMVIPAWYAVSKLRSTPVKILMVALICTTLWPYHHLVMVGLLLAILIRASHHRPVDSVTPPPADVIPSAIR